MANSRNKLRLEDVMVAPQAGDIGDKGKEIIAAIERRMEAFRVAARRGSLKTAQVAEFKGLLEQVMANRQRFGISGTDEIKLFNKWIGGAKEVTGRSGTKKIVGSVDVEGWESKLERWISGDFTGEADGPVPMANMRDFDNLMEGKAGPAERKPMTKMGVPGPKRVTLVNSQRGLVPVQKVDAPRVRLPSGSVGPIPVGPIPDRGLARSTLSIGTPPGASSAADIPLPNEYGPNGALQKRGALARIRPIPTEDMGYGPAARMNAANRADAVDATFTANQHTSNPKGWDRVDMWGTPDDLAVRGRPLGNRRMGRGPGGPVGPIPVGDGGSKAIVKYKAAEAVQTVAKKGGKVAAGLARVRPLLKFLVPVSEALAAVDIARRVYDAGVGRSDRELVDTTMGVAGANAALEEAMFGDTEKSLGRMIDRDENLMRGSQRSRFAEDAGVNETLRQLVQGREETLARASITTPPGPAELLAAMRSL